MNEIKPCILHTPTGAIYFSAEVAAKHRGILAVEVEAALADKNNKEWVWSYYTQYKEAA